MKRILFGLVCLSSTIIANDFIKKTPNNNKRKSSNQLKQDIGQQLADLVQIEAKITELNAQIQSKLFNQIIDLTENNKQSWFNKSKQEQLQKYSDALTCENKECELRLNSLRNFNTYLDKEIKL